MEALPDALPEVLDVAAEVVEGCVGKRSTRGVRWLREDELDVDRLKCLEILGRRVAAGGR